MTSIGGYHHFEVIKGYPDNLKCVHCNGLLKDAKELPCGHLICEICLQILIKARLASLTFQDHIAMQSEQNVKTTL